MGELACSAIAIDGTDVPLSKFGLSRSNEVKRAVPASPRHWIDWFTGETSAGVEPIGSALFPREVKRADDSLMFVRIKLKRPALKPGADVRRWGRGHYHPLSRRLPWQDTHLTQSNEEPSCGC